MEPLRNQAFHMFTDLAVIDWIALVFAAVLLAAALAAAFLAYITTSRSDRPAAAALAKWKSRPAHAAGSPDIDIRNEPDDETAAHGDRSPRPAHAAEEDTVLDLDAGADEAVVSAAVAEPSIDADRRLAERAARLRGRPFPETPSTTGSTSSTSSGSTKLEHRSRVQQVATARVPAHAEVIRAPSMRSGVSSSPGNFDRAEGFKARNPGFFDDPMGRHELRYWDGHTWTEYVKEHGERFTDPL